MENKKKNIRKIVAESENVIKFNDKFLFSMICNMNF